MPTLPNLQDLMMLCNLYQVDLNYILAQTDIPSKTNHDIAKVIHTSEETISAMRNHPEYAFLVDALIESDIMGELGRRTIQLAHLTKLRTLVETAFPRKFIERIEKQFEKFYYTIFPLDMNQGSFEDSLSELLPYNATFDTEAFIEANFLEEAQTYLHNKAEDFSELSQEEQYHIILSVIADFSYDYFISLRTEELSKQRLDSMLSEVLDNAIQQKAKILQYR